MHLFSPIVTTAEILRILEMLGLHERENPFHDSNHSCLRSRVPGILSDKTHACGPKPEISSVECQSQISASSQCSYRNTRKRQ